jgi:hypothetical protein
MVSYPEESWAFHQYQQDCRMQERKRQEAEFLRQEQERPFMTDKELEDYKLGPSGIGDQADTWKDKPHRLVYDLVSEIKRMKLRGQETIVAVSGTQSDGPPYLLGYAIGAENDIRAFFDDNKGYGLKLSEVKATHIPAGYANTRAKLLQEKAEIEAQLEAINKQLKIN